MKINILKEIKESQQKLVNFILREVSNNDKINIALPSHQAYNKIYHLLSEQAKIKKISFQEVNFFVMSEYVGVNKRFKHSLQSDLQENFFSPMGINKEKIFSFDSLKTDKKELLNDYEVKIEEEGGLDLALLYVNKRGNILYNDYGGSFSSLSDEFALNGEEHRRLQKKFPNLKELPKSVFSMGIGTILSARKILVPFFGFEESKNAELVIEGNVSIVKNSTALQFHSDTYFFLDEQSSVNLAYKSFYYWNNKFREKDDLDSVKDKTPRKNEVSADSSPISKKADTLKKKKKDS